MSAHIPIFGLPLGESGKSRRENGLSTLSALSNIDSVDSDGSCHIETLVTMLALRVNDHISTRY